MAAFVLFLVLFVALIDWNAFRGTAARIASGVAGRTVTIRGDLDVEPLSLYPKIIVRDFTVGDPQWAVRQQLDWAVDDEPFANVDRAVAELELLPLLIGRIQLRSLELTGADIKLVRDVEGRANWSGDPGRSKPLRLPLVRRFVAPDAKVSLVDAKRSMRLTARVATGERAGGENPNAFRLEGDGALNDQPFTLTLEGGPLLNVNRSRPYPFTASIRAGATRVEAAGSLARPFDFGRYQAELDLRGPDLALIYHLTGLALPNTPPYHLKGRLLRSPRAYVFENVSGVVGDSDIAGRLDVATGRDRPFLDAAFRSRRLDFDDLATVLGAPPATSEGESASAGQRAMASRMAAQGRLFLDSELDLRRVRSIDARLRYEAQSIVSTRFPVRAGSIALKLDQGVMTFEPLSLTLDRGRLQGPVRIDARGDTPDVDLDLKLTEARLETLISGSAKDAPPLVGPLTARIVLRGQGRSVRDAMASADGRVSGVVTRGEVREAFAELTGINVTRGLGLLLSGDQQRVAVRCGVAEFAVADGIATPRTIVVDTENVLITGKGAVDLRRERFDLEIQGDPKEPRLIRVMAPIKITGPLRAPAVGVEASDALAQGGLGALLGALVAPVVGILPFVDPGLAEDADCAALVKRG